MQSFQATLVAEIRKLQLDLLAKAAEMPAKAGTMRATLEAECLAHLQSKLVDARYQHASRAATDQKKKISQFQNQEKALQKEVDALQAQAAKKVRVRARDRPHVRAARAPDPPAIPSPSHSSPPAERRLPQAEGRARRE